MERCYYLEKTTAYDTGYLCHERVEKIVMQLLQITKRVLASVAEVVKNI